MTRLISHCGAALTAALASTLLFACSGPSETQPQTGPQVQQDSVQAELANSAVQPDAANATATIGGDGSSIRLSPIETADVEAARLGGELGCSFTKGDDLLLLASGVVASKEPAFGIVKVGDYVESISAPGGFDAMIKGATFAGKGKTIRIELTSGTPLGGGESPPFAAKLTYIRADGASRTIDGLWTCGP